MSTRIHTNTTTITAIHMTTIINMRTLLIMVASTAIHTGMRTGMRTCPITVTHTVTTTSKNIVILMSTRMATNTNTTMVIATSIKPASTIRRTPPSSIGARFLAFAVP